MRLALISISFQREIYSCLRHSNNFSWFFYLMAYTIASFMCVCGSGLWASPRPLWYEPGFLLVPSALTDTSHARHVLLVRHVLTLITYKNDTLRSSALRASQMSIFTSSRLYGSALRASLCPDGLNTNFGSCLRHSQLPLLLAAYCLVVTYSHM